MRLVSSPDPPRKAERGSGVLSDISCHYGVKNVIIIYILHLGLEFSDDLDCCTVWFTKAAKFLGKLRTKQSSTFLGHSCSKIITTREMQKFFVKCCEMIAQS